LWKVIKGYCACTSSDSPTAVMNGAAGPGIDDMPVDAANTVPLKPEYQFIFETQNNILFDNMSETSIEESQQSAVEKEFESTLWDNSFDLGIEVADNGLEAIVESDLTKEIPVVKSLVAFYRIYSSYQARKNVKKVLTFLQEFRRGASGTNDIETFKRKFQEDQQQRGIVVETILDLLEKLVAEQQSKILANLFLSYLKGDLDWPSFLNLSFILNNLNPAGYKVLFGHHRAGRWHGNWANKEDFQAESYMFACGIGHRFGAMFRITQAGQDLFTLGILPCNFPDL